MLLWNYRKQGMFPGTYELRFQRELEECHGHWQRPREESDALSWSTMDNGVLERKMMRSADVKSQGSQDKTKTGYCNEMRSL